MRCLAIAGGVVAAWCGCADTDRASSDGAALTSVTEGEIVELEVPDAVRLVNAPSWTALDAGVLRLAPPCGLVHGTDGAPVLVTLHLARAGGAARDLLVQVRPSGAGSCTPIVEGCIVDTCSTVCGTGAARPGGTLRVDYTHDDPAQPFSDLALPPRFLRLELSNPDPEDVLATRPTSDAPIKLAQVDGTPRFTTFCGELINANVVGTFSIDYSIVRPAPNSAPSPASPFVSGGAIELDWNTPARAPFGVEVTSCATTIAGCCVETTGSSLAVHKRAGGAVTLWLRVWAAPTPTNVPATLAGGGAALAFTRANLQTASGAPLKLQLPATIDGRGPGPQVLTATIDASVTQLEISLAADGGGPAFHLPITIDGGATCASARLRAP